MKQDTKKARHNGHRDRMFNRIQEYGVRCLEDHELLEVLLFYALPRVNTNEIAHDLLDEIGSLENFGKADESLFSSVKGLGTRSLTFFTLLRELFRRCNSPSNTPTYRFNSMSKVGEYLKEKLSQQTSENFCALFLGNQLQLLRFVTFSGGGIKSTPIDPCAIARRAAKENASCVILAHNHPGGYTNPSEADIAITEQIRKCLRAIGVDLVEHVIVTDYGYAPMLREKPLEKDSSLDESFYKKFYG